MHNKVHVLKTWPEYFVQVTTGHKPFELRYNDRNFQKEDQLCLREFQPCQGCKGKGAVDKQGTHWPCPDCNGAQGTYSGREAMYIITYMLDRHEALRPGYVILGVRPLVK